MHAFCDEMVFLLALIIFQFFSDENEDIHFSISKKIIARPRHFFFLFSVENQDIYFALPNVYAYATIGLHMEGERSGSLCPLLVYKQTKSQK